VRHLAVVLAILVASGASLAADQDPELKAAQAELKLAQGSLQAAGRSYGEFRGDALEHLKRAQREIRLGLLDAAQAREHGPNYEHKHESE
jgi:hypothetical protein